MGGRGGSALARALTRCEAAGTAVQPLSEREVGAHGVGAGNAGSRAEPAEQSRAVSARSRGRRGVAAAAAGAGGLLSPALRAPAHRFATELLTEEPCPPEEFETAFWTVTRNWSRALDPPYSLGGCCLPMASLRKPLSLDAMASTSSRPALFRLGSLF